MLYTFSVDGVTLEDFKLAEALDAIPVDYSQRWRDLHAGILRALPLSSNLSLSARMYM